MESIESANVEPTGFSIARCRELLDDESCGMSDEEIDLIRQHANAMAHMLVEIFLESRTAE